MKRRDGFTVAESICALFISSMIVISLSFTIASIKKVNSQDLDAAIDWYVFIQELESADHCFQIEAVQPKRLFLYSQISEKEYELTGNTHLYLTCRQGGYLPLLDHVASQEFCFTQLDSQRVKVEVKRENGKKSIGIIKFNLPAKSLEKVGTHIAG